MFSVNTKIITPYFRYRYERTAKALERAAEEQRALLKRLLELATDTEWGHKYGYGDMGGYEDFAQRVPLSSYEDLKGCIDRMRHGENDVLWPGRVKFYAKSSGTTNDKSKYLPVSREGLEDTHYNGGRDSVAYFLHHHPESHIFGGRALILGGSHEQNYDVKESLVGDLSAILIENINSLANLVRTPSKRVALIPNFEEKRELIARRAMKQNVTNISGVPSWMLSVLSLILEISGKKTISDVWPNLEVFFHGGVAFTPYRKTYKELIPSERMNYMETYNASEGFFGLQTDPTTTAMQLMTNYGVFYEFVPLEQLGRPDAEVVPLWDVETGRNYAMVISTSSGLWRYLIGDTVKFDSVNPYFFHISGRTKSFINAFGEELMVDNAEQGLAEACAETGAVVAEYTAAPIFMDAEGKCRHQWVVEFRKVPEDTERFAEILDLALQRINSDYEAKRSNDITLQRLELIKAPQGLFDEWLKRKGKLGGQHKVPRLCNDRKIMDEVLAIMAENK